MIFITNKFDSIRVPYDEDLLLWLQEQYPRSQYRVVEIL
jgi:hypothetical protein